MFTTHVGVSDDYRASTLPTNRHTFGIQYMSSAIFQHDGLRTPLNCERVDAGQTATEGVNVVAPAVKGQYQLMLTLVQEGICWFEHQGFKPAMYQVLVG